ncbi:efflux RND transporter periplasmic adaptor subunit [Pendulispora rubella]|uniref:Efflux RND transporter periplasmic adaptor subunit n=1 Tax=Pendulispora rubella TaxID=2741070 RepID=A0ABZ2LKQ6_9BACT
MTERITHLVSWVITGLVLAALIAFLARSKPPVLDGTAPPPNALGAVRVLGPGRLHIEASSPLRAKLAVREVTAERSTAPLLEVTGSVLARLEQGHGPPETRWQFASSELLGAYAEWSKSGHEVAFAGKQLDTTRRLDGAKVDAQTKVVDRLSKLVQAGSDSPKDLAVEETNLIQTRLEGQKGVHEAETALRTAERGRAALARQLEQAGLDPELLGTVANGSAVLVAEVPESKAERAREGQTATASFYGVPGVSFTGKVRRISPTVSKEQRTLRVLVELDDAQTRLRPGMFADVGLGTDARTAIRVPADAVLHVGRSDYVLIAAGPEQWTVTRVVAGESRGADIEILDGVPAGAGVMGAGAILLKPFVVEAAKNL